MDQAKFDRRFQTSCIMAAAFLAGLIFVGGIFWFLKDGSGTLQPEVRTGGLSGALLLSGIAVFGAVPFVRRQILTSPDKAGRSPSEDELLGALSTAAIVSLALLETACYFYLIYFFIRGEMLYLYAALAVGVLGWGMYFPRREDWQRYLEAHSAGVNQSNTEVDYGQR